MKREVMLPGRGAFGWATRTMLALFVVAGLGVWIQGCGADPRVPSVVWDGSGYAVAWAAPEDGKVAVYAHRFDERDFKRTMTLTTGDFPTQIIRTKRTLAPPEIAFGESGFVVFVHKGDQSVIAQPLDKNMRIAAQRQTVAKRVDNLCVAPAWTGNAFAMAYTESHEEKTRLVLALIDPKGQVIETSHHPVSGPGRCALAANQGALAIMYSQRGGEALLFSVTGSKTTTRPLASDQPSSSPLRIIPHNDGWAVLYAPDGELRVEVLARNGSPIREIQPPPNVDRSSVDIAANRHGLFLSWLDNRRVKMRRLDGEGRPMSHRVARDSVGTRAVGHAKSYAAAWTSDRGRRVNVVLVK